MQMGHAGWIAANDWPRRIGEGELKAELEQCTALFNIMPREKCCYSCWIRLDCACVGLREVPLVRVDFGPGPRLNEIEILPDLFGEQCLSDYQ